MSKRLQKTKRVSRVKRSKIKKNKRRTRRSQINRRRIGRMRGGMQEVFFEEQPEETVIRTLLQPNITFKKLVEMRRTNHSMKQTIDRILTTPELLKEKLSTIDEKELVKLYTKKDLPFYQTIAEVVRERLNKEKQKIQSCVTVPQWQLSARRGRLAGLTEEAKENTVEGRWEDVSAFIQQNLQDQYIKQICDSPEGGLLVLGNYVWVWGNKINRGNYGMTKNIQHGELVGDLQLGRAYATNANTYIEAIRDMDFESKLSAKMIGIPLIVQHHMGNTAMRIIRIVNMDGSAYYIERDSL